MALEDRGMRLVRSSRGRTLALVEALNQDDLDYSPKPGQWSVGEILDHIILSDGVYYGEMRELFALKKAGKRPYLRRSFADIDASILFIPKTMLSFIETPMWMMNQFLPREVREFLINSRLIPAQTPEIARPRPCRSGEVMRRELQAAPDELAALFAQCPNINYKEFKHYHPLLGENNLMEILEFLTNHETLHQKQIQEAIVALESRTRSGVTAST